jgi:hypothetical protein
MPRIYRSNDGNGGGRPKGVKDSYKRGERVAPGYGYISDLMAKKHTAKAINKMAELMENAESQGIQLAAAIALYDRAWGRPRQTIELKDSEPAVRYYSSREIRDEMVRRGLASVLGLSMPKAIESPKLIESTELNPRPRTREPLP